MGTNYYARIGPERCEACGRETERIHLGKSSAGWLFSFRHQPDHYVDFPSFCAFLKRADVTVTDEYGDTVTPEELIRWIDEKQKAPGAHRHANIEPPRGVSAATMKRDYPVTTIDGYEFCDYEFS